MKLLWVAANKPGSRLIRWGLQTDCSHFAVSFDEDDLGAGIAFHSYGVGTQVVMLAKFLESYTIVHALEPIKVLTLADEEAVYQAVLKDDGDRGYDYGALAWFAWRAVLAKVGWRQIDGVNRWQSDAARLCTGVAPAVLNALGVRLPDVDPEMTPPHELYRMLLDTGQFRKAKAWVDQANLV